MFRIPKNRHGKTIKWMLILKLDLLHGPLNQLLDILTNQIPLDQLGEEKSIHNAPPTQKDTPAW